jgi:hypothetical protein
MYITHVEGPIQSVLFVLSNLFIDSTRIPRIHAGLEASRSPDNQAFVIILIYQFKVNTSVHLTFSFPSVCVGLMTPNDTLPRLNNI